jgi:hypothetical protein
MVQTFYHSSLGTPILIGLETWIHVNPLVDMFSLPVVLPYPGAANFSYPLHFHQLKQNTHAHQK